MKIKRIDTVQFHAKHIVLCGLAGAFTSRMTQWGAREVYKGTGFHIGGIINHTIPKKASNLLKSCTEILQCPLKHTTDLFKEYYLYGPHTTGKISDDELERRGVITAGLLTKVIAPLGEELIYRGFVQNIGAIVLELSGMSPTASKVISITAATLMFGLAHVGPKENFNTEKFSESVIAGIVMAGINEKCGLGTACFAHILHNVSIQ